MEQDVLEHEAVSVALGLAAMPWIIIISDYSIADARRLNSHLLILKSGGRNLQKTSTTFYNYL